MTNNIKLLTSIYRHEKGIYKEDVFDEKGNYQGIGFLDKDGNQIKFNKAILLISFKNPLK